MTKTDLDCDRHPGCSYPPTGFVDGVPLPEDLLDDEGNAAAFEAGKGMGRDDAVAYALEGDVP